MYLTTSKSIYVNDPATISGLCHLSVVNILLCHFHHTLHTPQPELPVLPSFGLFSKLSLKFIPTGAWRMWFHSALRFLCTFFFWMPRICVCILEKWREARVCAPQDRQTDVRGISECNKRTSMWLYASASESQETGWWRRTNRGRKQVLADRTERDVCVSVPRWLWCMDECDAKSGLCVYIQYVCVCVCYHCVSLTLPPATADFPEAGSFTQPVEPLLFDQLHDLWLDLFPQLPAEQKKHIIKT